MKIIRSGKHISIALKGLKIIFPLKDRSLSAPSIISRRGVVLAESLFLCRCYLEVGDITVGDTDSYDLERLGDGSAALRMVCMLEDKLRIQLLFEFDDKTPAFCRISIEAWLADSFTTPFSLKVLPFTPGLEPSHIRLAAGLYSGWTMGGHTLSIIPCQPGSDCLIGIQTPRMLIDIGNGKAGRRSKPRCAPICFSYPPVIDNCLVNRHADRLISGNFAICLLREDINSPSVLREARMEHVEPKTIPAPRYPVAEYLSRYLEFLDHPEMFISMGGGFGLYHRGFFNCSNEGTFRRDLGKDKDEKQYAGALLYKHDSIKAHLANPEEYPRMRVFGEYANMCAPLCDIVWGGAHNLQTALFLYRQNALPDKAATIVRTLLRYKNRTGEGFQIANGKLQGAWWNTYQPDIDRFSNRYFDPLAGVGDQGLWAHYLCQLYREGYCEDGEISRQVTFNCANFLEPLVTSGKILLHAYQSNGKPGYTRERVSYQRESPFARLMAALAFISAYRLTGDRHWKQLALKQTRRGIDQHYRFYEWGWQEYDTLGQDTMGMGRSLMALCELYKELQLRPIKDTATNLMEYLYHCQHHADFGLERYMNNGTAWGGTVRNVGGFLHGYTYGSLQGLQTLTFRSDLSEGLVAYYKTFGGGLPYESLIKYFNLLTHHQVIRKDIKFGFGSTSEHLNLKADYVQDTFQISNAMPYGIEAILGVPHLSSSNTPIESVRIDGDTLFVRFRKASHLFFSVQHTSYKAFQIQLDGGRPICSANGAVEMDGYNGDELTVRAIK